MSRQKDVAVLIAKLEAQGWTVTRTGNKHWRCAAPDGKGLYFMPSTPSDHRSIKNTVSALRRLGADL